MLEMHSGLHWARTERVLFQERYFRKCFYDLEGPSSSSSGSGLGLPEVKKFMQRISHKVTTSSLKEQFSRVDEKGAGAIGFDDFSALLQVKV